MKILRYIAIILILLTGLTLLSMRAQDLPQMPSDSKTTTETLPNGMRYYVAEVPGAKGVADFALVGRLKGQDTVSTDFYRRALTELTRFKDIKPQTFFLDNGAMPDSGGYLKVEDKSVQYNFRKVRIGTENQLLDSALLVVVALADHLAAQPDKAGRCSSSDLAVIVAGDVKAKEVQEKLKLLSLFTAYGPSSPTTEHLWNGDQPSEYRASAHKKTSQLDLIWRIPRTPKEYMGTTQPAIYNYMMGQMGLIAEKRLREAFRREGIPYTEISYSHLSSAETFGDEEFRLSVGVSDANIQKATETISRTLGSLDEYGASIDEMNSARYAYIEDLTAYETTARDEFVVRCTNSFLRSASLSSASQVVNYFSVREINDSTEVRLLNTMLSSLLDCRRNLVFECPDSVDPEALRMIFEDNWNVTMAFNEVKTLPDTLLCTSQPYHLKHKMSRKDHFSGGSTWTFSNGMKVIYKNMDTAGKVYWSLGFGDGYGSVADLEPGEGAFFADYFEYCKVAGVSWNDFQAHLANNGIKVYVSVDAAHTTLEGVAPKDKLPLLMRSIRAIVAETQPDKEEYEYYYRKQWLETATSDNARGVIDSLMFPGNKYTQFKMQGKLSLTTMEKCQKFYQDLFLEMNSGLLVLVSDADEAPVRKELSRSLAAFPVGKGYFSLPIVRSQPVSGWSIIRNQGPQDKIYMSLSTLLPLTSVNAAAAVMAGKMIEDRVAEEMAARAMTLETEISLTITPNERLNITMILSRVDIDGLGLDAQKKSITDISESLRNVVSSVLDMQVSDDQLNAYKPRYKDYVRRRMKDPCFWTDAILTRYIDGKDFLTDFEQKADLVTTKGIEHIFNSLSTSSRVEYIIIED